MKCKGTYKDDHTCDLEIGCGLPGCVVNRYNGMSALMRDVRQFHQGVGAPMPDKPTVPPDERVRLRANLILEECRETIDGMMGASWHPTVMWDDVGRRDVRVDMVKVADGLADMIYVIVGTALEFGIPLDKVWAEVQRSNMAKIGPDGKFAMRSDGKIMKPEGWVGPDIEGCLK